MNARPVPGRLGVRPAVLGVDRTADRFEPTGDHHRNAIDDHPLGGHGDGLQARRAEAVDRDPRRIHRKPRAHCALPGDIMPGRPFGHAATHDHILDLSRFYAGAGDGGGADMAAQPCAVGVVEGAAVGFAGGRVGGSARVRGRGPGSR